jgi:hypothetical protein
VWSYLRGAGHFTDSFKQELFLYQRLEEFGEETQAAIDDALVSDLQERIRQLAVGELPDDIQARVWDWIRRHELLVDPERLRLVERQPIDQLPDDLRSATEMALGAYHLRDAVTTSIGTLPTTMRDALWRYLDGVGYFVDDEKRAQVMERRLADLSEESFGVVVADLAQRLMDEIGDRLVSDLDDATRQGLREAVESSGFFDSDEERERLLSLPLGALRREDLDALAIALGQRAIESREGQSLSDLDAEDREAALAHLESSEWFVDRGLVQRLDGQRLGELAPDLGQGVVTTLGDVRVAHLGQRRLSELSSAGKQGVQEGLRRLGLGLEASQMRPHMRKGLAELDQKAQEELQRSIGGQVVASWGDVAFGALEEEPQTVLVAILGRQIMGRIERRVLLHTISRLWIDYLTDIEDLRRGIGLEAYAQRDPLVEYKRRAFELFEQLGDNIRRTTVRSLFRQSPEPLRAT